MHRFRLIIIALITFLFVTGTAFLRKAFALMLCGILSFNSVACYGFLKQTANVNSDAAIAVLSPSNQGANSSQAGIERKDAQKVVGCIPIPIVGGCVNVPTIPNILAPKSPAPAPAPVASPAPTPAAVPQTQAPAPVVAPVSTPSSNNPAPATPTQNANVGSSNRSTSQ